MVTTEEFATFAQQRRNLLISIAGRISGFDTAEDVMQTALLQAWEHRTDFRGEVSLSSWVGAIVRNAALDSLRKRQKHRTKLHVQINQALHVDCGATPADRQVLIREMMTAASHLPPVMRTAIRVYCSEVTAPYETSTGKVALHRAKLTLRKRLEYVPKKRLGR